MARYKSRTRPFRVHLHDEGATNDKEDSGVHLEEPSSPVSKVADELGDSGRHSITSRHGVTITKITRPTSTESSSFKSHTSSGSRTKEKADRPTRRVRQYDSVTDKMVTLDLLADGQQSRVSINTNPRQCVSPVIMTRCISPVNKKFQDSVNLEEDEGLDVRCSNSDLCKGDNSESSSSAENSDAEHVRFSLGSSLDSQKLEKAKAKETKRRRFRKFITGTVLHRSQSVGCEKDLVPEHALFLQYEPSELRQVQQGEDSTDGPKRMIHKTCSADAAMMAAELIPSDPSELVKNKQKISLAKNVKKKFQKLRRRNTDSLLGATLLTVRGTTKITAADAQQWGNSFESLLADKNGLELFRNFLKSEFSDENIEFWEECEEFKTIRTNKLEAKAQKIYSDYVALKAPRQVNLDSKTRLETVTSLENPTRDMFKSAQKRIQFLMENDSYKRFLESEEYKRLLSPSTSTSR